ncbi:Hypothetical predicted protein [Cloeon dipterum]|uniref:Uncharacterized protein n=1 Tax=Cloeon dipterum TaxID=197152 RepID=A0A8S1E9P4_9INSE|nr:Hypothetical predicted protein [Cloeon dipterum]
MQLATGPARRRLFSSLDSIPATAGARFDGMNLLTLLQIYNIGAAAYMRKVRSRVFFHLRRAIGFFQPIKLIPAPDSAAVQAVE